MRGQGSRKEYERCGKGSTSTCFDILSKRWEEILQPPLPMQQFLQDLFAQSTLTLFVQFLVRQGILPTVAKRGVGDGQRTMCFCEVEPAEMLRAGERWETCWQRFGNV
jgi:hypothetical protein